MPQPGAHFNEYFTRKTAMKKVSETDIERLKFSLAVKLEEKKWAFKQKELEFNEAGQHLRSLNGFLWQVPGMAIAITGGIWYGVSNIQVDVTKAWILCFVGAFNILTIVVLWRLRWLIDLQILIQKNFIEKPETEQNKGIPTWPPQWLFGWLPKWFPKRCFVVTNWSLLLASAALLSFVGAAHPTFIKKSDELKESPSALNLQLGSLLEAQTLIQAQIQTLIRGQLSFSASAQVNSVICNNTDKKMKSNHKKSSVPKLNSNQARCKVD
ncbi:hypothetical protein [Collimonas pratensis]|nr:hypothetical protein [Collimonas pratensis]